MSLEKVIGILERTPSFLVTSHVDLDGDAAGSELALMLLLQRLEKAVSVINQDPLPPCYRFLPASHAAQVCSGQSCDFDAAIVLDCTCMERTGAVKPVIEKRGVPIVNIDHHHSNVYFGAVNFVKPDACASALLILQLADRLGQKLDPDVATCLYTAILTETGSFRFSNTSPEALAVCARLAGEGADPSSIASYVFGQKSPVTLRLIGEALRSLEVTLDGAASIISLDKSQLGQARVSGDDLEGVVNFAMAVEGVKVASFLRELPDGMVKVSLRSGGAVDVDRIARQFGGGGHSNAAGAKVQGDLGSVKGILLEKIAEVLSRA